jgi:Glycosyl transferase 4-like domain
VSCLVMTMAQDKTVRVLALMEATSVAGPAKNLIEFARRARQPEPGRIRAEISIVTFERGAGRRNAFVQAAQDAGIPVIVLSERRRFDSGVLRQLRDAVLREKPDIIQSHNNKSHLLVRLLRLHREYPWMAFNHGYTAVDLKDRIYSQFDRCQTTCHRLHFEAFCLSIGDPQPLRPAHPCTPG